MGARAVRGMREEQTALQTLTYILGIVVEDKCIMMMIVIIFTFPAQAGLWAA